MPITNNNQLITLDITDLYVNIPISTTIDITRNLLSNEKIEETLITQACNLLDTILKQNYLKFNDKYYKPNKGVAMGSPISSLISEIFLQYHENILLKNILDAKHIKYYNRYVDDILIIYDNTVTNADQILTYMNNINNNLQFKLTIEEQKTISFLDLLITRNQNNLTIYIYRKPTTTDTTIHYNSNHPTQHKLTTYRFIFNILYQLPLTQEQQQKEKNIIYQIAKNNGYSIQMIEHLNRRIQNKTNKTKCNSQTKQKQKWAIFEYHNPVIQRITNIFKNTDLHISFQVKNTTQYILRETKPKTTIYENSGIYSLSCNTCNLQYIGQTGRNLKARYSEHCRYIKTNDPKSAYALYVLNNRHEYGPIETTMSLIRSCRKGSHMNTLENFYIQYYYQKDILIPEQQPGEHCILFNIVKKPSQTYSACVTKQHENT